MSLMGPVVRLHVLCLLLAVSSPSSSVKKSLMLSSPSPKNNTSPVCNECSNNSTSQNTSEVGENVTHSSLVNTTRLNKQLHNHDLNESQDGLFNQSLNYGKQNLTQKINGSLLQPTTPAAESKDPTIRPEVTDVKKTAGVPSNTAHAIIPANTTGTTTSTTTLVTSTQKTTAAPPTTPTLSTTKMVSTPAPKTTSPVPRIVTATVPKTTTPITKEPAITSTVPFTITSTSAASTKFVSTSSSPTVQYLSPVVEVAGRDLTSQLLDTASLLAILLFGLLFFCVVVAVFVTQAYESYRRKDYTQVDYLINGMYADSGV
ncbi:uncharacterized protein C11orf24 homolog isoform X2 [Eucyclogobius newberryi]|uniref:uncharacterized protein C11orf24 homolog isoform X2 n=1 Tax=Eucyclogobius newberryi TaxID=166745 RepID=UPI003B5B37E4